MEEKADVVIVSVDGYPKDLNLYQAQKILVMPYVGSTLPAKRNNRGKQSADQHKMFWYDGSR